ncbi:hypothetical protein PC129_g25165 [Phytophthora cactorum]|uniref:Uncharacterized protein n=1 Tax=Phytophthora cactorum TaxID=29920 RepID=A0A8T1GUQ9_9STRA|nr:hypothetical protein PC129_g25165 [Phytophthora cactorum]
MQRSSRSTPPENTRRSAPGIECNGHAQLHTQYDRGSALAETGVGNDAIAEAAAGTPEVQRPSARLPVYRQTS